MDQLKDISGKDEPPRNIPYNTQAKINAVLEKGNFSPELAALMTAHIADTDGMFDEDDFEPMGEK